MSELARLQKAFTGHLRNPEQVPVPAGLDPRRVGIYSELIFNNLSALVSDFFPVIKSLLSETQWRLLIRDFFISHQAETPYFPQLSEEFVHYLAGRQARSDDPGFLLELAHYEWLELHLFWHRQDPPSSPLPAETLEREPLRLSAVAEPVAYQYPVHRIGPDFRPEEPDEQPTFLLVFRDLSESVRFFELQPFTYQFLEAVQQHPGLVAEQWLGEMASELSSAGKVSDRKRFMASGFAMLQQFNQRCVLGRFDQQVQDQQVQDQQEG
ncbi:MAG: putative DNA-binding domain-containing protein [Proteobacteria bacterium]|nr:putative DNA-binding domain-containing protein [Pseudomonadota bacterium]MDA1300219.1 putative DNA-binding domain-containing protein [Pseudomonadota bacterium]